MANLAARGSSGRMEIKLQGVVVREGREVGVGVGVDGVGVDGGVGGVVVVIGDTFECMLRYNA